MKLIAIYSSSFIPIVVPLQLIPDFAKSKNSLKSEEISSEC